jgi:hypothetical protein
MDDMQFLGNESQLGSNTTEIRSTESSYCACDKEKEFQIFHRQHPLAMFGNPKFAQTKLKPGEDYQKEESYSQGQQIQMIKFRLLLTQDITVSMTKITNKNMNYLGP